MNGGGEIERVLLFFLKKNLLRLYTIVNLAKGKNIFENNTVWRKFMGYRIQIAALKLFLK